MSPLRKTAGKGRQVVGGQRGQHQAQPQVLGTSSNPLPLDKAQPQTEMRALTGTRNECINYTRGNPLGEKESQIYIHLWTQKSSETVP